MASLSRGFSFRRQGSSGLSWTDTRSFNEEGALVRTMKEEVQQRFAGSSLSRIHDSLAADDDEEAEPTCHSHALLGRSKSVDASTDRLSFPPKPSPNFFKRLRKALLKLKK